MNYPVLYSFKRCPYAMRARMALKLADIKWYRMDPSHHHEAAPRVLQKIAGS